MERLTKRYDDGEAFCDKFSVIEDVGVDETILKGELIDKLAAYEDAEEQGLLLKLPCKVGDKVYELIPRVRGANNFRENEVVAIKVYCDSVYLSLKNGFPKDIKQIGKILFLTKEEAEQALKRMEGE